MGYELGFGLELELELGLGLGGDRILLFVEKSGARSHWVAEKKKKNCAHLG
jgi:hypothetical protein